MSKINLDIDFSAVRERIGTEMVSFKKTEWARKVGVSKNIVTNVHGAFNQKPSLEYIVAVSIATDKPVDYYLWGKDGKTTQQKKEKKNSESDNCHLLNEIQEWLTEQEKNEKSIWTWFRIHFNKSFPDFSRWQKKHDQTDSKTGGQRAA